MFDIGFSEIVLIAIIALLVVGPQELPALVRSVGSWLGKARHFMSAVKTEFDKEIHKADEIKRLIAKEMEIAEAHKTLDEERRADRPAAADRSEIPPGADARVAATPVSEGDIAAPAAKQDHGTPQT
jgi:sec-independent protein translocase protein TatB